jgi:hypothetical protein
MRLTTLTLALVTAAALSGCAANPRVEGLEPAGPPPLRVWIGYPIGSSRVHPIFVNREAHVAMFEIIPGRGVTMVYPQTREDLGASASHYADLAMQPGRMFYHSDPFGHASFQPRYYYAVASAAPLNLTRLRSSLGATRRALGRMYASYRSYDVIDRLTELVVPMQADEDWATDLFVDWPVPAMPPTFAARRLIACANGHVIHVPANYPYHGCPGDAQVSVATPSAKPPIKELPRDSLRRPRMPGDRQRPTELSDPGVEKRRRAEPGARPPRTGSVARRPTEEAVRHSGDRATAGSSGQTPRAQASEPASSSGSSARRQTVERREPRAEPAPESGESGKQRKPDTD